MVGVVMNIFRFVVFAVCVSWMTGAFGDEPTVVSQDELWNGRRTVYRFRGREAWVIEPKVQAEGRPWTWTVQWWNAFVPRTAVPDMIAAGAHHVVLDMFDTRVRTDADLATMAAWQAFVVKKYGLCPKARLIGMSWGGFFSTRYAAKYPENVGWIYYDCPLLNFDKFASDNPGRIGSWANDLPKDGKWSDDPRMPVNLAGAIAKAGIKTMIAYGGQDQTVTPSLNSEIFISRLKAAGAEPIVKYRYAYGHHPHGMEIGERVIPDFFEIK